MQVSTKNPQTQRTIEYRDFSGGLNTADSSESIGMNELAKAVNVCIDRSTGLLKTICGADALATDIGKHFDFFCHDRITDSFILADTSGNLYSCWEGGENFEPDSEGNLMPKDMDKAYIDYFVLDGKNSLRVVVPNSGSIYFSIDSEGNIYPLDPELSPITYTYGIVPNGKATGKKEPHFAAWEDGILMSSGGKLQYYSYGAWETIGESPEECNGVFIKDGRVWVWYKDRIQISGVGDERNWALNGTAADSQWIDIGYKDSGDILGIVSLLSDAVVFKDNGHAYHMAGQFPDWTVKEIGRQLFIRNPHCCISVGNNVIVLGDDMLQAVSVTNEYGDMRATEISRKIAPDIYSIGKDARLRFVPSEGQVWMVDPASAQFLTYDIANGCFFYRRYDTLTKDVLSIEGETYILREHIVSVESNRHMNMESGLAVPWMFIAKTLTSYNEFLLKRVFIDTTPFHKDKIEANFNIGDTRLVCALPLSAADYASSDVPAGNVFHRPLTDTSDYVFQNSMFLYGDKTYLKSLKCYRSELRCVDRRISIPVRAYGAGGILLFNKIAFFIAEV